MMQITRLLKLCRAACDSLTPFIKEVYNLNQKERATNVASKVSKVKSDNSAFTIADGIVQHALVNIFLLQQTDPKIFKAIVGEEKNNVNLENLPFTVDELIVPTSLEKVINEAKTSLLKLSIDVKELISSDPEFYKNLCLFVDPIDGTKQFVLGEGYMCTVLIGIVRNDRPVGGVVFRPLTNEKSFAMGCKEENFFECHLNPSFNVGEGDRFVLRSQTSVSHFLDNVVREMKATQIRISGAGNKVLMLLEYMNANRAAWYIQDRGVSRWDTCAGEAVLEAYGGIFLKLSSFSKAEEDLSLETCKYSYAIAKEQRPLETDIDFSIGLKFTKNNIKAQYISEFSTMKEEEKIVDENNFLKLNAYSNTCGIFGTCEVSRESLKMTQTAIRSAAKTAAPQYS